MVLAIWLRLSLWLGLSVFICVRWWVLVIWVWTTTVHIYTAVSTGCADPRSRGSQPPPSCGWNLLSYRPWFYQGSSPCPSLSYQAGFRVWITAGTQVLPSIQMALSQERISLLGIQMQIQPCLFLRLSSRHARCRFTSFRKWQHWAGCEPVEFSMGGGTIFVLHSNCVQLLVIMTWS